MTWIVATFYRFVSLSNVMGLRNLLLDQCKDLDLRGTILLAEEGINGTIAGSKADVDTILGTLRQDPRLATLSHREAVSHTLPFQRMKVKIKREIVTLGQPDANPTEQVGHYVEPQDWNALISDPEVIVIDTRNDYEVSVGSFHGAINPETSCFRDFPRYVQTRLEACKEQKIALFCTGGIRCEKATAYLLCHGFAEVYHLKGGILSYLEQVDPQQSLWQGECFVFDERVAVQHGLMQGTHHVCRACGYPLSPAELGSDDYREGVHCPQCRDRRESKF